MIRWRSTSAAPHVGAGRGALGRRQLLFSAAAVATGLLSEKAWAMGRVPVGGRLVLRVPWGSRSIDPHDLFDPLAAVFGHAIADPVYALDGQARPYPTLADGMPRVEDGQTVVRLRPGLRSARSKALTGRDLAWSIKRARNMGGAGLLGVLGPWVRSDRDDPLVVRFGRIDPARLALLLTSPVTALLPVGFSARSPDGTGPFVAKPGTDRLELSRNLNASRGPSYLDAVTVRSAGNMAESLRAFETGRDSVCWLGTGLYGRRAGARPFDYGHVGWVVLATGRGAGHLAMPGVAQQLANQVPIERLPHLGLKRQGGLSNKSAWTGDPTSLLVDGGSGQLLAVAESVAAALSRPGHEVTVSRTTSRKLRRARRTGDFTLALDVVRRIAAGPAGDLVALASADRAALGRSVARHPPRLPAGTPAHRLTGTTQVGVLGELVVRGAVAAGITLAAVRPRGRGMDLGSSYRS